MKLHLYHHFDHVIGRRLIDALETLVSQGVKVMTVLDDLTANVQKIQTQDDSIIQLLTNVKAKLDEALANPNNVDVAALKALSDTLGTEADKVAAAVTANTPAA